MRHALHCQPTGLAMAPRVQSSLALPTGGPPAAGDRRRPCAMAGKWRHYMAPRGAIAGATRGLYTARWTVYSGRTEENEMRHGA